jgi:hypothetical protein
LSLTPYSWIVLSTSLAFLLKISPINIFSGSLLMPNELRQQRFEANLKIQDARVGFVLERISNESETQGADLQHVHGTTYHNVKMASNCFRASHPINHNV